MSFRSLLSNVCDIHTPGVSTVDSDVDDWNNPVSTDPVPTVQTNVPCNVYTRAGREYSTAQRVLATDDVMFDFLNSASISNASWIVFDGSVYTVEQVSQVGRGHHKVARTARREGV